MSSIITSGIPNASPTMSSREIATLCEKQHKHVIRDIEKMLDEVKEDRSKFGHIFQDSYGRDQRCYNLPQNLTLNLITGYRADLRLKVIDRWMELEAAPPPAVDPIVALNDPATMRGLLLTYSEKVIALESANAELTPKADALDRIARTEGTYAPTDAAKTLGVRPIDLIRYLRGEGRWVYRRQGTSEDVAYQDKLQRGLMEHKVTTVQRSDGSEKTVTRARITAKGLSALAETFQRRAA